MTRQFVAEHPARSPQWFDAAHQADIRAAYERLLDGGLTDRGAFAPRPERVLELGQLAAASELPARAALLRWGALPAGVRAELLHSWYGVRLAA
ncbi:DUF810 domain-containing protein [Modestobacter lapidis]|nr:DUF810 domain-containing protein [Modestobacter lapidis]